MITKDTSFVNIRDHRFDPGPMAGGTEEPAVPKAETPGAAPPKTEDVMDVDPAAMGLRPDLYTTPTSPHTIFCGFTIMGLPWGAVFILISYLGWYFLIRRQSWRFLRTPQNPMLLTADPSTLPPPAESTGANGVHSSDVPYGDRSPPPTGVHSIAPPPVYVGYALAHLICNISIIF